MYSKTTSLSIGVKRGKGEEGFQNKDIFIIDPDPVSRNTRTQCTLYWRGKK